jgi:hypothetical protein
MAGQDQTFEEFRKAARAKNKPRGAEKPAMDVSRAAFDRYKKKAAESGWPELTPGDFRDILRAIHGTALDDLCDIGQIRLPLGTGRLFTSSWMPSVYVDKDGNEKMHKTAVDFQGTLRLWYEDPKAKEDKVVLHFPPTERIYKIDLKMSSLGRHARYLTFKSARRTMAAFAQRVRAGHVVTTDSMYSNPVTNQM